MSVQPRITRIATTWPGNFVVDDLVVPLAGAADVPQSSCSGSLEPDLLSVTYAASVLTFTFRPQTLHLRLTVVPSLKLGTATLLEVAVDTIDTTAQTIAIRFRTPAGAPSSPPLASDNAELQLAIFRPLPVR